AAPRRTARGGQPAGVLVILRGLLGDRAPATDADLGGGAARSGPRRARHRARGVPGVGRGPLPGQARRARGAGAGGGASGGEPGAAGGPAQLASLPTASLLGKPPP